ncbi:leucine-rich repeat-containing protein 56-like [Ctenocephalides felis]|uniref:leucine-rich repeat-containing protein 56-like n=1 Tax=Ctenocephalides felis TaxID=7515 RepID=UPI000E6E3514|nr:leucine-rich repeat-containing protein 56-like [Ctenocephalides felis]
MPMCRLQMVLPGPDGDNQPSASNQDDNLDILERILREPPDQDRGDQEQMLQRLSRLRDPMANLNVVNTRYGLVSPLEPTLYELLQRICASEANGEEKDVESLLRVTMRVTSRDVSLQRLHLYVPALQELVLEGSRMTSIRDLGCDLVNLKLLNISNCGLDSLDGTNGLPVTLEKLYAARNRIRDVICVVSLEGLQLLDLSGNRVRDISTLGFLTLCEELRSIFLANCPCADIPDFRRRVRKLMPHLHELDGIPFQEEDDEGSANTNFINGLSTAKHATYRCSWGILKLIASAVDEMSEQPFAFDPLQHIRGI